MRLAANNGGLPVWAGKWANSWKLPGKLWASFEWCWVVHCLSQGQGTPRGLAPWPTSGVWALATGRASTHWCPSGLQPVGSKPASIGPRWSCLGGGVGGCQNGPPRGQGWGPCATGPPSPPRLGPATGNGGQRAWPGVAMGLFSLNSV